MKRLLSFSMASILCVSMYAGGLVTNTNQSASWVRMPARDASTSADAVYFNPAGLMKLDNGFHFSLSNQTIWQNREITNNYSGPTGAEGLNQNVFKGEVFAPFFPSIYGVYKMDKIAISFGFNAIGGGGGATYNSGLPSFEIGPSDLVPSLASQGVTDYRLETFFEGTSVFFGYQGGVSYKINDMISVYAGLRYVTAKNTYNGYLRSIEINPGGNWMRADLFFTGLATQVTGITGIPTSVEPIITGGGGALTLAQAEGLGYITDVQRASIEAGLGFIGLDQTTIDGMDISTISGTVTAATPELNTQIQTFTATSNLLADKEADVVQEASGITPIVGLNLSLSDKLNIGMKYEFATKLEFTNTTTSDILLSYDELGNEVTMFPDKATFRGDMPAMLSVGADYKVSERLRASAGMHYYFDKSADYGKKIDGEYVINDEVIDKNYMELAGGLEFDLTEKILVSGGYLLAKTGVSDAYQSDLSYSLSSSTVGFGGAYKLNDHFMINLGFGYTFYVEGEINKTYEFDAGGATPLEIPAVESYYKDNMFVAIGVDFSF